MPCKHKTLQKDNFKARKTIMSSVRQFTIGQTIILSWQSGSLGQTIQLSWQSTFGQTILDCLGSHRMSCRQFISVRQFLIVLAKHSRADNSLLSWQLISGRQFLIVLAVDLGQTIPYCLGRWKFGKTISDCLAELEWMIECDL